MILYFSATGNTEYIAKKLAKGLHDECINLLDRVKKTGLFHSPLGKTIYYLCSRLRM